MLEPTKLGVWANAFCAAMAASALTLPAARAQSPASFNQGLFSPNPGWTMGGGNVQDSRNQPATSISPANVAALKQKWVFTTGGSVSATPAVVGGLAYFPDFAGNFYAVDANSGVLAWSHKIEDWTGIPNDYARSDPAVHGGMVIFGNQAGRRASWDGATVHGAGASMVAADAKTGAKIWVTQIDATPGAAVTGSPVVYDGVVYVGVASVEEGLANNAGYPCCTFRGSLVALDAKTGAMLWQTYVIPDNHGLPGGYSGGSIWGSTPAIDPSAKLVYIGTGNNFSVPAEVEACIKATPHNAACSAGDNYFDSVLAMDLKTGAVKWARRALAYDTWTVACFNVPPGVGDCPSPEGLDYDFGAGPNVFVASIGGRGRAAVGIGGKNGAYYALDAKTGTSLWTRRVGPGNVYGGIVWGTATDGALIYVPIADVLGAPYRLQPSGLAASGGSWAGLDPATGRIAWQTATPGHCPQVGADLGTGCAAYGPVSVGNGVLFAGSMDTNPAAPTMFALSAATGQILWAFPAGSSVNSAPAIVGDSIYWGAGYGAFGTPNTKVFAFSVN